MESLRLDIDGRRLGVRHLERLAVTRSEELVGETSTRRPLDGSITANRPPSRVFQRIDPNRTVALPESGPYLAGSRRLICGLYDSFYVLVGRGDFRLVETPLAAVVLRQGANVTAEALRD